MFKEKIIFFYPSFERGGATKIIIRVINYLLKKKTDISLFSCNARYSYFIKSKKLKIIGIQKKNKSRLYYNLLTSFYLIKFLLNSNDKIKIFSFQSHLPAIILAKLFKKKIIIRNSEEIFGATKYANNKLNAIITLLLKVVFYNFADRIIAISKKSKSSLEKITLNKDKVELIYNPYLINNKSFKADKNKNININKIFNILCIGRMTEQKNFRLVIAAINNLTIQYPNIRLTLVGDGPLKKKLINIADKNVTFVNWTQNVKKYFLRSNLFILPSHYEGLPNALIDSSYYNVPSISTDCSGARDILLDNKGGYIIPIDDLVSLIKTVSFVINNYENATNKVFYAKKNLINFTVKNCKNYYQLIAKV
jgi:glycosyltransferase involved in cell wall biosynthesis